MSIRGEFVEFLLRDVGAEVDLGRVTTMLGLKPRLAPMVARSPSPPYATFPPPLEIEVDAAAIGIAASVARAVVRVHRIGTISVRIRIPFDVEHIHEAVRQAADVHVDGRRASHIAGEIIERVRHEIRGAFVEPYDANVEPEGYTAICITHGLGGADEAVRSNRQAIGAMVQGEPEVGRLADEPIESAFRQTVRYYRDDATIIGWDNAVLIAPPDTYDDVLGVIEMANLELLELRTYDAYLDHELDSSIAALERLWAPGGFLRSARSTLESMSSLRADLARLTDTLRDTGKLFGEWYLAKVHRRLRDRFHLNEWEAAVNTKMETLEDMFQLAEEEANHRRAIILETMIVVLFVLDLALLFVLSKG